MGFRFTVFVFIHVYLNACLYGSQKVPVILNTKLETSFLIRTVVKGTLPSCVDTCVFITDCLSVSYNRMYKNCEMFNSSSTLVGPADLVLETHTVLIDAANWPRFRTGECWQKPCPAKMKCVSTVGSYSCQIEGDVGCPPYELPEHGTFIGTDAERQVVNATQLFPVGSGLNVGCGDNYVISTGSRTAYWLARCQDNLNWDLVYSCYTVGELCIHDLLDRFYPSRAQISVTSSVTGWSSDDALIDSGDGWIAETSDAHQHIQIEFDAPYWIGGIKTKGGAYTGQDYWVTHYNVAYSTDCITYNFVMFNSTLKQLFVGNTDATSSMKHYFDPQINVKCLRVHPNGHQGRIVLGLGLLACRNYV